LVWSGLVWFWSVPVLLPAWLSCFCCLASLDLVPAPPCLACSGALPLVWSALPRLTCCLSGSPRLAWSGAVCFSSRLPAWSVLFCFLPAGFAGAVWSGVPAVCRPLAPVAWSLFAPSAGLCLLRRCLPVLLLLPGAIRRPCCLLLNPAVSPTAVLGGASVSLFILHFGLFSRFYSCFYRF
ncbi:hypothetical protein NPIL_96291, partial [Nephila pilipes]